MNLIDDIILTLETVTPEALAAFGAEELAPLFTVAEQFVADLAKAIETKQASIKVETAAADIAADVAVETKFPKP